MVADPKTTQPLNPDEISNLLEFIGYGNLQAPVWFLGMEEGGGGEDRIRIQSGFEPIEDLRDAHVYKLGISRHHCGSRALQSTWNKMCQIMLSLAEIQPDLQTRRIYQAGHLGRLAGDTLLAELMPIAKTSLKTWEYHELIPMFRNRQQYYDEVLPVRLLKYIELVSLHSPRLIVAYGRAYWHHYQSILGQTAFHDRGRFRHGTNGKTTMVLTDHFAARTMNCAIPDVVALIKESNPDLGSQLTTSIS